MDTSKMTAAWFTDLVEQIINFLRTAINFITENMIKSHYVFEEEKDDTQPEG